MCMHLNLCMRLCVCRSRHFYVLCLINTFGISASSLLSLNLKLTLVCDLVFVMETLLCYIIANLTGVITFPDHPHNVPQLVTLAIIYNSFLVMAWFCLCFTGGVGLMGYSWSRGLWQTATAELPRHWCYTYVFLSGFTRFTRKYSRKMDARGKQTIKYPLKSD